MKPTPNPEIIPERQQKQEATHTAQLIVFKLGGEDYALEISQIKEVVPTPNIAKVPLTPAFVEGVANIRGNILAIVNLEKKFGLPVSENSGKSTYTLVIESDEVQVGFLVHEVPNTLSIPLGDIDESPLVIQESAQEKGYIKGIVKSSNRLIILLDLPNIISKNDIQTAVNAGR